MITAEERRESTKQSEIQVVSRLIESASKEGKVSITMFSLFLETRTLLESLGYEIINKQCSGETKISW